MCCLLHFFDLNSRNVLVNEEAELPEEFYASGIASLIGKLSHDLSR